MIVIVSVAFGATVIGRSCVTEKISSVEKVKALSNKFTLPIFLMFKVFELDKPAFVTSKAILVSVISITGASAVADKEIVGVALS